MFFQLFRLPQRGHKRSCNSTHFKRKVFFHCIGSEIFIERTGTPDALGIKIQRENVVKTVVVQSAPIKTNTFTGNLYFNKFPFFPRHIGKFEGRFCSL
jgi:hypothetical protein